MESVKTVTLEKGSAKVELQKIINAFNQGPKSSKGFDPQDLCFRDAEKFLTNDEDYLEDRKITHCGSDRAKLKGAILRKRGILWGYKGIVSNYCFRLPPCEAYFKSCKGEEAIWEIIGIKMFRLYPTGRITKEIVTVSQKPCAYYNVNALARDTIMKVLTKDKKNPGKLEKKQEAVSQTVMLGGPTRLPKTVTSTPIKTISSYDDWLIPGLRSSLVDTPPVPEITFPINQCDELIRISGPRSFEVQAQNQVVSVYDVWPIQRNVWWHKYMHGDERKEESESFFEIANENGVGVYCFDFVNVSLGCE